MNSNDEIKFGIRKTVLENEDNRTFLKKELQRTKVYTLSVITAVTDSIMELHSYVSSYKPLDVTKMPNSTEGAEYQKALIRLIKSENGNNVIWFASEAEAILYIESAY